MASYTTNLNLTKPSGTDTVSIGTINGNMDIIDSFAGSHFGTFGSTNNPVTNLDNLPLNCVGNVVLDASVHPKNTMRACSFIKSGTNASTRYTILIIDQYEHKMYSNDNYNGTLKGWVEYIPATVLTFTATTNENGNIVPSSYVTIPTGYKIVSATAVSGSTFYSCIIGTTTSSQALHVVQMANLAQVPSTQLSFTIVCMPA